MQTLPRVFTPCAVACAILLASLLLSSANAQRLATAGINGVVTDAAGKSVGNILLTLTNTKQGTVRTYTTQVDGVFAFSIGVGIVLCGIPARRLIRSCASPSTLAVARDVDHRV